MAQDSIVEAVYRPAEAVIAPFLALPGTFRPTNNAPL